MKDRATVFDNLPELKVNAGLNIGRLDINTTITFYH
jgi:16S rRNA U516 pseudouridylate synthase RsuA-like enzyme